MRTLLTAQPGWGHVVPVLSTASQLQRRGHEVLVATGPRYLRALERAGVPAVGVGLDWDLARADDAFCHLGGLRGVPRTLALRDVFTGPTVGPFLADLLSVAEEFGPDVIVSETWEMTGGALAEARGIPAMHLSVVALALPPSFATPHTVGPRLGVRSQLGLPEVDAVTWAERQRTLFGLPSSWHLPGLDPGPNVTVTRPPIPDAEQRGEVPAVIRDRDVRRPLVLATLGTVFWDNPQVLRRLAESAAGEPYDMLLAIGDEADPDSVGSVPGNVRVERHVPFSQVLPHCKAVVTHGGFGTTGAAVREGVPLVMLPVGADQFVTAGQVERLGIGVVVTGEDPVEVEVSGITGTFLNPDTLTAGEIREATRRVLTDTAIRTAAAAQRSEVEAIPEDAAVVAIEGAAAVAPT